jgi:hypothetical protein
MAMLNILFMTSPRSLILWQAESTADKLRNVRASRTFLTTVKNQLPGHPKTIIGHFCREPDRQWQKGDFEFIPVRIAGGGPP